jgi:hypothetical protein
LRLSTLAGDLLAWKYLAPEREEKLKVMRTPLYGPEGDGGSPPFAAAMREELAEAGLARQDFVQNTVPGMQWKEEPRDAFVKPADVGEVRIEPDEINGGRVKATLQFALPRGSYATMLIKRLFAPSWYQREDDRGGRQGGSRFDRGPRQAFRGSPVGDGVGPARDRSPVADRGPVSDHGPDHDEDEA